MNNKDLEYKYRHFRTKNSIIRKIIMNLRYGTFNVGNTKEIFDSNLYINWRTKRIKKLIDILGGENWFKSKSILELGAGFGHISQSFINLNSNLTICDGRISHVNIIKNRIKKSKDIFQLDNDEDWSNKFKDNEFDLVIHWGLLYHLDNWERDLKITLSTGKIISLESEVCDSDKLICRKRKEFGDDQSIHKIGSFPSSKYIEKIINECECSYERYDDQKLNSDYFNYSWKSFNDESIKKGYRRFLMI